jgi:hypothetical protein
MSGLQTKQDKKNLLITLVFFPKNKVAGITPGMTT